MHTFVRCFQIHVTHSFCIYNLILKQPSPRKGYTMA